LTAAVYRDHGGAVRGPRVDFVAFSGLVAGGGRGCTLSELGYAQFTRPKCFHLKTAIG
jgi:hypothetical protein